LIIWIAALILSAGGARAEGLYQVNMNDKSCSDLLTNKAPEQPRTPLDYHISDLEGLFFTYLAKMQTANEVPGPRLQYFLKDVLSMKAEILNDVTSILPYVAASPMDEGRRANLLNSIYEIVETMGVPGSIFGFKIDEDGTLLVPRKKQPKKRARAAQAVFVAKNEAIGFLGGLPPERDLPGGTHRSIGFGTYNINREKPPQRKGGAIQRSISDNKPDQVVILDGETGGMYVLPIARVGFSGGQVDGKVYRLDFNKDTVEWVVTVENLNNPTGRIGF
jgi:hypothetical protein